MIFLSNELLDPKRMRQLKIPMTFISFAIMSGAMFSLPKNPKRSIIKHFNIPSGIRKTRIQPIVYGALFHLEFEEVYLQNLDAMHLCSRYILKRNNFMDEQHRIKTKVSPIYFKTLEDFSRLKYIEKEPIESWCYIGNINHPKIKPRLRVTKINYRITQGVLPEEFKKLFWEVNK